MWFQRRKPPDWRVQFVAAIRVATRDDSLDFEAGARLLEKAHSGLLLKFDAAARRTGGSVELDRKDAGRMLLREALGHPDQAELLLFFESCNSSGFVREKALRALRGHDGRLACAAALLRSEDWVRQVADVAQAELSDYAGSTRARHFFEFLDLIGELRRKQRFAHTWPLIERALLDAKWQDRRRKAVTSERSRTRKFALELSLKADRDDSASNLLLAAQDPQPLVAGWALANASALLTDDALRAVLLGGIENRMSSIRADALRRLIRAESPDAQEIATSAALDRSQTVRRTAAYLLQQQFGISALPMWRTTFDEGRFRDEMTIALAEMGDKDDEPRLREQLNAHRARTRAAALRGLARLNVPDLPALLDAALHDAAALMVGTAARIYSSGNEFPRRETLEAALAGATTMRLRARLLSTSRLLPKWERLAYLLEQFAALHSEHPWLLERELRRWCCLTNRTYTSPTQELNQEIRSALARLRSRYPSRLLDEIEAYC